MKDWLPRLLVVALLLQLAWRGLAGVEGNSQTHDEFKGLHAGWAALVLGDYRFNPNAPLADLLQACALLDLGLRPTAKPAPPDVPIFRGFDHARAWLVANPGRSRQILRRGRLVTLGVVLVGLALLAAWASRLWGPWGGALVVAGAALDPTLIGHGHLATQDAIFAVCALAAVWAAERLAAEPSWRRALPLGLTVGLALSAKHSGVLTGVYAAIVVAVDAARRWHVRGALRGGPMGALRASAHAVWRTLGPLGLAAVVSVLVVVALHRGAPGVYLDGARYLRAHLGEVGAAGGAAPSLLEQAGHVGGVLAAKLPVSASLLLLAALCAGGWRCRPLLLAVMLVGAALASGVAVSARHLLPVLPCAYLALGALARERWRVLGGILVLALAVESGLSHPGELGFTNRLTPPDALTGHDVDIGQDLRRLDDWRRARGIARMRVAYFGQTTPEDLASGAWQFVPVTYGSPAVYDRPVRIDPTADAFAVSQANRVGLVRLAPEAIAWIADYPTLAEVGRTFRVVDLQGDALAHYRVAHLYLLDAGGADPRTVQGVLLDEYRLALARDPDRRALERALEELRGWLVVAERKRPGVFAWGKQYAGALLRVLGLRRQEARVAMWRPG